jgi:mutator protein MutT
VTGKPTYTAGAFAIVRDERGRVLWGRRLDRGTWALPGGVVERGETPMEAVVRETREETGIDVEVTRLAVIDWKVQQADIVFVFECRLTGGVLSTSAETSEVAFISMDELPAEVPSRYVERVRAVLAHPEKLLLHST